MVDLQMYNFNVKSNIHDYSVKFIGNLSSSLDEIIQAGDTFIVDKNIHRIYHNAIDPFVKKNPSILINANENQKSYQELIPIIDRLIQSGFKKNNRIIAIGGGITQDISAFISSILYRGVHWIFYPTTLLAQGDSCIGSKTSINFGDYKNQIGGFYPPKMIFILPDFLSTLSDLDIRSGMGEMCHYFIVSGDEDFHRFKNEYDSALKDKKVLSNIISKSLQIKKSYIEIDEFDRNIRQVFNYGHSFGHAIETLSNYRVPHGIAVSYGMDIANFVSVKCGYIGEEIRKDILSLLVKIWHGIPITDISLDRFFNALARDKKSVGTELRLILNKGFGNIVKVPMKIDDRFIAWISEYFETQIVK
jgi:3-dehydroquinate synthase